MLMLKYLLMILGAGVFGSTAALVVNDIYLSAQLLRLLRREKRDEGGAAVGGGPGSSLCGPCGGGWRDTAGDIGGVSGPAWAARHASLKAKDHRYDSRDRRACLSPAGDLLSASDACRAALVCGVARSTDH
jgi:hypothetical protein